MTLAEGYQETSWTAICLSCSPKKTRLRMVSDFSMSIVKGLVLLLAGGIKAEVHQRKGQMSQPLH